MGLCVENKRLYVSLRNTFTINSCECKHVFTFNFCDTAIFISADTGMQKRLDPVITSLTDDGIGLLSKTSHVILMKPGNIEKLFDSCSSSHQQTVGAGLSTPQKCRPNPDTALSPSFNPYSSAAAVTAKCISSSLLSSLYSVMLLGLLSFMVTSAMT